ncbi:MAG: spermidine synthase [Planctomyces sp.]
MFRFAATIFLSAFLLFQVQPLTGRYILPWFGGGPSIWTACMLFFQILLLGGYLYSHLLTSRLPPRRQVQVHGLLVLLSLLWLPIAPDVSWKPTAGEAPLSRILLLLAATVGAPYFVLSTTGPLMQRWFTWTSPGASPWRLYALSNVGSLLALLSYPFVFEPLLTLRSQVVSWSVLYLSYGVLAGLCAIPVWRMGRVLLAGGADAGAVSGDAARLPDDDRTPRPSWTTMGLWLLLSAASSVMFLATTNQLCIDVATVPFLWILPLSLYLLSFILCFDSPHWYNRTVFAVLLMLGCPVVCDVLLDGADAGLVLQIAVFCTVLFAGCMCCHGELYGLRPASRWLTLYFVVISAGGAVGGLFVALGAPRLFTGYYEYHSGLGLVAVAVFLAMVWQRVWLLTPRLHFWVFAAAAAAQLLVVSRWFLQPVEANLSDSNWTILVSIFGALLAGGLLVTGLQRESLWRLCVLWLGVGVLEACWLSGFVWWKAPAAFQEKFGAAVSAAEEQSLSLPPGVLRWFPLICVLLSAQAILVYWAFSRGTGRMRSVYAMMCGGAAGTLLLLGAAGVELAIRQTVSALLYTAVSGLLLDVAARGFRGRGKPELGLFLVVPGATLLLVLGLRLWEIYEADARQGNVVALSRNFYGVLRVRRYEAEDEQEFDAEGDLLPSKVSLTHGQIRHGFQFEDEYWCRQPTTYYGYESGLGMAIQWARAQAQAGDGHGLKVGVVGLGTGTIAAYGRKGDVFRFYEINPDVVELSTKGVFTYLADSEAEKTVVLGDARIMLEHELGEEGGSQQFDVLAIDAFSSDAIPVHLLTTECAEIYQKHLRNGGVLAVHISNRFLDLAPVARGMARHLGWQAIEVSNGNDDTTGVFGSTWFLLTASSAVTEDPTIGGAGTLSTESDRVLQWTDDYSGLWQVLTF